MLDDKSRVLKIGPLVVSPGLLLAPMEDITDLPFRLMCKRLGADIVYTAFVNAEGLQHEGGRGEQRSRRKMLFLEEERPIGIQLCGASAPAMERAAQLATEQEPDLLDINCGCWVGKVALRGAGAGLLRDLAQLRAVVSGVVRATRLPVTVKTRLGWEAQSIRIVEVAQTLEELGVQGLTIHCRTRAQGHKGEVDYEWIGRVKEKVAIPVILNGDVTSAQDAERVFATTSCDGVMIGRGALRHPWIFREARHYLQTGGLLPLPDLQERIERCLDHLDLALEHQGERPGLIALRRHYAGYFRILPGAARLRAELMAIDEPEVLRTRLQDLGSAGLQTPESGGAG